MAGVGVDEGVGVGVDDAAGVGEAAVKVKPSLVAVPPGVVTLTVPLEPGPTTAVIWVDELTAKL